MESPSHSLIVALLFIGLTSLGLGTLISNLARSVQGRRPHARGVALAWEVMLFVSHLNLIWHVLDLLSRETWTFLEYAFVQLGPCALVAAVQIIGEEPDAGADETESRAAFLRAARRFFPTLAFVQMWLVGVDWILGQVALPTLLTLASAGVCAALTFIRSPRVHGWAAAAVGGALIANIALG